MTASILPLGETQFFSDAGVPLALGNVYFYVPATTTDKNTWQDSGKVTLNTNPVALDAAGRALIYGEGTYRQVVKDSAGNTIWDQLVTAPITGDSWPSFGALSGGNVKTITTSPSFTTLVEGQMVVGEMPAVGGTNTGSTTLNANSTGNVLVTLPDGSALAGGELKNSAIYIFVYTGANWMVLNAFYGRGTFTPSFTLGAGSITTYNVQKGFYERIGNIVNFNILIKYTGSAGPGGALTIGTLPFTAENTTDLNWPVLLGLVDATNSFALSGANITFTGVILANSTAISIVSFAEGNGAVASAGGALATAGTVGLAAIGWYRTQE